MLGKNIANLRKEKHMTQEELAAKLLVSRQAVSKWESSLTEPDVKTLIMLSDIFEVSVDELIKGKNEIKEVVINEEKSINGKPIKSRNRILSVLGILFILGGLWLGYEVNNGNTQKYQVESFIRKDMEDYSFISDILIDVDIVSFKNQIIIFKGTFKGDDYLESGTLYINYEDKSQENIVIKKIDNNRFSFEKEIPAKNVESIKIVLDDKEIMLENVQFVIEEYMYGINHCPDIYSYEDRFEIENEYYLNRNDINREDTYKYVKYFDLCMNIYQKDNDVNDEDISFLFPMTCKVYKDEYVIKELTINSMEEFKERVVIDEQYHTLATFYIELEYKTPLGNIMKYKDNLVSVMEEE